MSLPENIKDKLPENYLNDFEIVEPNEIKKNDYITYWLKPREKYEHFPGKPKEGLTKGGYVGYTPSDEELKKRKVKGKIWGLYQVNKKVAGEHVIMKKWSVLEDDVLVFFKSKTGHEVFVKKAEKKRGIGKEKKRIENVKEETKKEEREIEEAKKVVEEVNEKAKEPVNIPPLVKEKRGRGRPKGKKNQEKIQ